VFCGSENDVLDRFWQAAKLLDVQHVVRITADCPILDPSVLRRVVEEHLGSGADYTSNVQVETFPDGLDVEVFRKESLEKAWNEGVLPSEREHVTPYMRKNPEMFIQRDIRNAEDLSGMRWTLDNPDDYAFLKALFSELGHRTEFGMDEVLEVIRSKQDIVAINGGILRNEGYAKSLREDAKEQK
jgi:spore coat polysaccharide biosynthesis protein SpsF (cytidylyltransferase family)